MTDAIPQPPTQSRLSKWVRRICAALLLIIVGLIAFALTRPHVYERAHLLKRGDDKAHVEKVMGKPDAIFMPAALFGPANETWTYDNDLKSTSKFPYFRFKLNLRFIPDSNDIAIEFGRDGMVKKITVPK